MGGKQVQVGFYLDEFYYTAYALNANGYDVVIVTPEGNAPLMDPTSNSSKYFESQADYLQALQFISGFNPLLHPQSLQSFSVEFDIDNYLAVFVPGGHAPIIDLMGNVVVGSILQKFWQQSKPMGFICHGPLVSLSMSLNNGAVFPFANKNMTVFSTAEEIYKEATWNATIGWYPDALLASHGAVMHEAAPFTSNVIVDGWLVTGQNPQSASAFAKTFLAVLAEYARHVQDR